MPEGLMGSGNVIKCGQPLGVFESPPRVAFVLPVLPEMHLEAFQGSI